MTSTVLLRVLVAAVLRDNELSAALPPGTITGAKRPEFPWDLSTHPTNLSLTAFIYKVGTVTLSHKILVKTIWNNT